MGSASSLLWVRLAGILNYDMNAIGFATMSLVAMLLTPREDVWTSSDPNPGLHSEGHQISRSTIHRVFEGQPSAAAIKSLELAKALRWKAHYSVSLGRCLLTWLDHHAEIQWLRGTRNANLDTETLFPSANRQTGCD